MLLSNDGSEPMREIHPMAKRTILSRIIDALSHYHINDKSVPLLDEEGHEKVFAIFKSFPNNVQKELESYLGGLGLWGFILDFLHLKGPYNEYDEGTALDQIFNLDDLAAELLEQIQSLPYDYFALIELPFEHLGRTEHYIEIAPGMALWQTQEIELVGYKVPELVFDSHYRGTGLLSTQMRPYKLQPGRVYLRIQAAGYLSEFGRYPIINNILDIMRSFIGCCISIDLFKKGSDQTSIASEVMVSYFLQSDEAKFVRAGFIRDAEARLINRLSIPGEQFKSPIPAILSMIAEREPPEISGVDGMESKWLINRLTPVKNIFEHQNDEYAKRILNATQWYFDGDVRGFNVLGYILTMTAIETLLGDPTPPGNLTQFLANRCAFLIGRGGHERNLVIKNFLKIYETRSKILHRGARELSSDEYTQLGLLRYYLERALKVEISRLS